jgi:hypothetical protein
VAAGGNTVNIRVTATVKEAVAGLASVRAAAAGLKKDLDGTGAGGGLEKAFDGITKGAANAGKALAAIGSAGSALGAIGGIAAAAAQASQSLLLLPAAISAVGIGMKTLSLAAGDFMEGMAVIGDDKKFQKKLEGMTESAKALALEFKSAHSILSEGLSETLFTGLAQKFASTLSPLTGNLKKAMDAIAKSANTAAKSMMDMLAAPARQADLKSLIGDSSKIWDGLLKSITPLSEAFLDLAVVGSDFLVGLTSEAEGAATSFAKFIAEARKTGQLKQWMSEGLNAVGELGKIAGNVAGSIKAIWTGLSAGMGQGGGLEAVTAATEKFQQLMESPAVQQGLAALGEMFKTVSEESGKVFAALMTELGPILAELAPVVSEVAKAIGEVLVAAIKLAGPYLLDMAKWMREHKEEIAAATPYILGAVVAIKALVKAYKGFKAAKGALDTIKELKEALLLTGAREAIDAVGVGLDAVKRGMDSAAVAAGVAGLAISALQLLLDGLSLGTKALDTSFDFGTALDDAMVLLGEKWDEKWAEFQQKVTDSLIALQQTWADFWAVGLGEAMTAALAVLKTQWDTFWTTGLGESLTAALLALQTQWAEFWATGLTESMNTSLAALQAAWDTFWTTGLGASLTAALLALQTQWATFWETGLTETMNTSLATLLAAWTTFWQTSLTEAMTTALVAVQEAWATWWVTFIETQTTNLALLLEGWTTFWTTTFPEAATTALTTLQETWATWWTTFVETQTTNLALMQEGWTAFWTTFAETMTTNLATMGEAWITFWNVTMLATVQTAMASILADVTTQMAAITAVVVASMEAMTAAVTAGMAAIQAAVSAGLQAILAETTTVWTAIQAAITAAMTAIQSAIETGLQAILSFWQTNWQTVYDFVKTLDWLGLGQAVVDGIRAGIEGGWAALESFVTTKAQGLLAAAKSAIGIASPSKDFRDQVGKQIPRGIAVGVRRYQQHAVRAVERMQQRVMAAGVVAGFQAGDPRVLSGTRGYGGGRRSGGWDRGWGHGWDRNRWGGRGASVVAGHQLDEQDTGRWRRGRYTGTREVQFVGDVDGAFATAFQKLVRTGAIRVV